MNAYAPLALALCAALAQAAQAAPTAYSAAYSTCMDASEGVTAAMLTCSAGETRRQDARLNAAFQAARTTLDTALKTPLRDTQRAWIQYRDANCALLGSLTGGSIDRLNAASCMLDMTLQRADELEALVSEDG